MAVSVRRDSAVWAQMVEWNQPIRPVVIPAVNQKPHIGAWMAVVVLLTACATTVRTAATTPTLSPAASPSAPIPDRSRLLCSTPPNRTDAGMACMSNLGEAVMFGGVTRGGLLPVADTWIWHGACWSELHPSHHPEAYRSALLAFDAIDGRVIAYLGDGDPGQEQATWSWDGTDWTRVADGPTTFWAGAPDAAMAYDQTRGRVLLYGLTSQPLPNQASGSRPGGPQTWTWTGSRWQAMNPRHSPGPRIYTSMAYDPNTRKVLLFGGVLAQTMFDYLDDTWMWDGSDWTQLAPAHSPAPRGNTTTVPYAAQSRLLLVGGNDTADRPDAWAWDGLDWAPMPSPGPRDGAAGAELGAHVILFGGTASLRANTDLWDGHVWTTLTG
jgi:hypothetical protein